MSEWDGSIVSDDENYPEADVVELKTPTKPSDFDNSKDLQYTVKPSSSGYVVGVSGRNSLLKKVSSSRIAAKAAVSHAFRRYFITLPWFVVTAIV